MPLHGSSRVDRVNQPITIDGEVEQQGAVVAHTAVIQVGQLIHRLDLAVLVLMIEPTWADARVTLAGTPRVAVGMARLQLLVLRVAGIDVLTAHEGPVCRVGIPLFVAHPAATRTTVREDDRIGLKPVHNAPSFGIVVVGTAVYLALLSCTSVPAIAAVGAVEPHLKHVAVSRHQLLELPIVIVDILLCAVAGLVPVPWREVYAHLEAILLAGIGEFAHNIALASPPRRAGYAVVGILAGP